MKKFQYYVTLATIVAITCKTDEERLSVIKRHSDDLMVRLDNDMSWIEFYGDEYEELSSEEKDTVNRLISENNSFKYFHGYTDGVVDLFRFAGITAESC